MATIKLGSTKAMNALITYAENEEKAEEKSGLNCDVDYVKEQMKTTRLLFGKDNGRQGYHVIQSFDPEDEITPEQANNIGQALAEKVAPGHEVAIYTHTDQNHLHNHICINSVNMETGKKFVNDRQKLYDIRTQSDDLCQQHELSIIQNKKAGLRYTQAEQSLLQKGQKSWKDEIRTAIEVSQATNYQQLSTELQQNGIEIERITHKTITYRHLEEDKKVRGSQLGDDFDKGGLEIGFRRKVKEQAQQKERERTQPIQPKQSEEREEAWAEFARTTSAIEQNRKRREREELERERETRRIEEAYRISREERLREEREKQKTHKQSRGFDLEL